METKRTRQWEEVPVWLPAPLAVSLRALGTRTSERGRPAGLGTRLQVPPRPPLGPASCLARPLASGRTGGLGTLRHVRAVLPIAVGDCALGFIPAS